MADVADFAEVQHVRALVEFSVFPAAAVAVWSAAHEAMLEFAAVAPDGILASDDH